MRRLIIALMAAATITPAVATAQTGELRRDRQEIREERRDLNRARAFGDRDDRRDAREDLRDARQEYREDWRDYRRDNRNVFRRGAYVAPRGYAYRPIGVGARIAPAFYGDRYIISDPHRYRLPRAAGVQRWVRYGNDVLLVNARTGRVVAVYDRFFW
jgi:Ni/Co efflux regulator RcnB